MQRHLGDPIKSIQPPRCPLAPVGAVQRRTPRAPRRSGAGRPAKNQETWRTPLCRFRIGSSAGPRVSEDGKAKTPGSPCRPDRPPRCARLGPTRSGVSGRRGRRGTHPDDPTRANPSMACRPGSRTKAIDDTTTGDLEMRATHTHSMVLGLSRDTALCAFPRWSATGMRRTAAVALWLLMGMALTAGTVRAHIYTTYTFDLSAGAYRFHHHRRKHRDAERRRYPRLENRHQRFCVFRLRRRQLTAVGVSATTSCAPARLDPDLQHITPPTGQARLYRLERCTSLYPHEPAEIIISGERIK